MALSWSDGLEVCAFTVVPYSVSVCSKLFNRAITTCASVQAGQNILITGIGGGVALLALQLCVAKGAHVYVTSGSQEKINKAIVLGAEGGANYKDGGCSRTSA